MKVWESGRQIDPATGVRVLGRCELHRGEAFLCGPKGGFWPDSFSKKKSPLGSFLNNVRRYQQSAAPKRLMTDLA